MLPEYAWSKYGPTEDDPWQYIVPNDDLKGHGIEDRECECSPRIDWEHRLLIHDAFDHRECVEQAKAIVNGEESDAS